jgi:hypothetical protein
MEEEVIKFAVRDRNHYDSMLIRHSVIEARQPGTLIPVDYDDLPSETMEEFLSNENVKFLAISDLGKISSRYASEGVKGYHDALEAEFGEHYARLDHSVVAANDGLFHKDHRFQVFLQAPWQLTEHERDGLFLSSTAAELISVKSRFGEQEYRQLLKSLSHSEAPAPTLVTDLWKVKDASKKLISIRQWINNTPSIRQIVGDPATLPLRGLAVSPVFTPGDWQRNISPHVSLYQRVSPHVFVRHTPLVVSNSRILRMVARLMVPVIANGRSVLKLLRR